MSRGIVFSPFLLPQSAKTRIQLIIYRLSAQTARYRYFAGACTRADSHIASLALVFTKLCKLAHLWVSR